MRKPVCGLTFLVAVFLAAPGARAQNPAIAEAVASAPAAEQDQTPRPQAIEYSEGYETRAKIHKYASFATLPLLGTEVLLGQHLYNDPYSRTSSYKGAHIAVGTAITGLFAVNTVTGVWNLVEGWKDPNHRALRLIHGVLMLASDGGFVAAYGTGPGGRNLVNFDSNKATHRAVAFTSIGVATGSYLLMLFGNK